MKKILALVLVLPLLAGCGGGIKKSLGLEKSAPDEFAVVRRAPLTVPPNFDLVPPQPGTQRPQEKKTSAIAQGLVLGSQTNTPRTDSPTGQSAAERAILSQAGAAQSDAAIRQKLSAPDEEESKTSVAQKLGISSSNEKGKALNATSEAQRLQQQNIKTPPVATKSAAKNAQ